MNFFPTPYPDEILYSVLARYSMRSGNISEIHNFDDLFGTRKCVATLELPANLDTLITNMPISTPYTAEEFIYNSTLFPYYGAFLEPKRAMEITELMKGEGGNKVYMKMGLVSGTIELNRYFRFCPKCLEEDIEVYGEPYWHRLHQATGIFVCIKHRVPLYNSSELIRGANRHRYITASEANCITRKEVTYAPDMLERLIWVAKDIEVLLNNGLGFKEPVWFKNQFRTKLIEQEYMRMNNFIKLKKLKEDFKSFYGEDFLELVQSSILVKGSCWLSDMVRDNKRTTFALRYLLLARFLDIPIKDLFDKPFGFNGEIGNRSNIIVYQDLWDQRLMDLLELQLTIGETARLLETTPLTLKKNIKRLGIKSPWEFNGGKEYIPRNYIGSKAFKEKRAELRQQWLSLHANYPSKSSAQIRRENSGIGDWLSKYDNTWYKDNYRRIERQVNPVDWEKRDRGLVPEIKQVVAAMQSGKPKRITWHSIAGRLGLSGWLVRKRNRLPQAQKYIDSVVENLPEFHIRKIKWSIDKLEEEGQEVRLWTIVETAGVKPRYMKAIAEEIRQILIDKGYDADSILHNYKKYGL